MDIHPPMKHMDSLKEYASHILVVTIGILIALGLEGVRESWREHSAVREARISFTDELKINQHQLQLDQISISQTNVQLDQIISQLDSLSAHPAELNKKVAALAPGFYFYSRSEWESANASGVIPHMHAKERKTFVNAYLATRYYQDYSTQTFQVYQALRAYVYSHHQYTPAERTDLEEKLRLLQMDFSTLLHVGKDFDESIRTATENH